MFKKTLISVLLVLFSMPLIVYAQTWVPANQVTIAWDAVTRLEDGSPIPSGQTVTYTIWQRAGTQDGPVTEGSTIETTQATIGFATPGRYYIGISSNLMQESLLLAQSAVSWSYDATVTQNGQTFGIIFSVRPMGPRNLRVTQ